MLPRIQTFGFVLLVTLASAAPAGAQQPSTRNAPALAGPRVELSATAVRAPVAAADGDAARAAAARRQNVGGPVALMIVGGAAIVLGAVIGGTAGTLFMVGGAVAALLGLYQYLQ